MWYNMEVDEKNIKRRERRFYRSFEDGKIKYLNKEAKENIQAEKMLDDITSKSDLFVKQETISENLKQEIIDKILLELKKSLNPDIDEISEVIYSQLSHNIVVTQQAIKEIVEKDVTRRNFRKNKIENEKPLNYLNNRQELELIVNNIVEENIREITREKKQPKVVVEEKKKKTIEKENPRGKKRIEEIKKKEKPEDLKKKETKQVKEKQTNKNDFKLDFGEDDDFDLDEEENDLGLKF